MNGNGFKVWNKEKFKIRETKQKTRSRIHKKYYKTKSKQNEMC